MPLLNCPVSWTYDGTSVKGYKNTMGGSSVAFTGPLAAGTNNISFCVNPAYNGDWYNGMIAGVAIYNRTLSSSEIATINGL